MELRNKHDRDPEWEKIKCPTVEEIIAFNRKEYKKKIEDRINFLEQQVSAGGRLDGYVLQGHRDEMKKLKEENERLNKTP